MKGGAHPSPFAAKTAEWRKDIAVFGLARSKRAFQVLNYNGQLDLWLHLKLFHIHLYLMLIE